MARRLALISGAAFGGIAVVLGAFGAHSLKNILTPHYLDVFETGVRYQMYHALALLLSGFLMTEGSSHLFRKAAWGFFIGILLFSGSLYGIALLEMRWLGPFTPLGGVSFIFGWACLAVGFCRESPSS